MKLGVDVLPKFTRDNTDRNRTSPFAFTGNKFEFRALGSSNSISCVNIMLNAAVAESLKVYADRLEGAEDFNTALHEMIKKTIKDHKRIIFNGNGYDDAWIEEATQERGLLNYKTTADCMPHLLDDKNVKMLTEQKVFTPAELNSRMEIMLDNYCKTITIEGNTLVDMVRKDILPSINKYLGAVASTAKAKQEVASNVSVAYEKNIIEKLSNLNDIIYAGVDTLEKVLEKEVAIEDICEQGYAIRDEVLPTMEEIRNACDEAEMIVAKEYWPYPSYGELLCYLVSNWCSTCILYAVWICDG